MTATTATIYSGFVIQYPSEGEGLTHLPQDLTPDMVGQKASIVVTTVNKSIHGIEQLSANLDFHFPRPGASAPQLNILIMLQIHPFA